MDILDIDEALKDDSFIFLEDKTHDDVSNILQQWKNNNCLPSQSQQHQQEQAFKLNSRTFTRPKRKLAQNIDTQLLNNSSNNGSQVYPLHQQGNMPILNLEIGGLVTTMHKSFLQDTSPPSSVCSSMDASMERMNNSLITSADFSNINFLQSTQSLDFGDPNALNCREFDLADKSTTDGYTLNDMIRDRKALECLTLSGDGTLIKDSHIAQFDDISLSLSKTASGCSTMDNSTESVEGNRTVNIPSKNRTYENSSTQPPEKGASTGNGEQQILHNTILLSDEMIGDTTFNLVENSLIAEPIILSSDKKYEEAVPLNTTHDVCNEQQPSNDTFKKPMGLDETVCVSVKGNATFDYKEMTPEADYFTPEKGEKNLGALKFYESTPQTSNLRFNKQRYTPSLKIANEANISPIVACNEQNASHVLSDTCVQQQQLLSKFNSDTFSNVVPQLEEIELIEDIENPIDSLGTSCRALEQSAAGIEMQNVMDMAQAEAELLASNDDGEEFEHMLDEISKVELNAERLKMKKSLETIKKRFNYGQHIDKKNDQEVARTVKNSQEQRNMTAELDGGAKGTELGSREHLTCDDDHSSGNNVVVKDSMAENKELHKNSVMNCTIDAKQSMINCRDNNKDVREIPSNGLSSSSTSGSSSVGERLLSRRSRLYDDINLSALSSHSKSPSASFTVQKHDHDFDASDRREIDVERNTEEAEEGKSELAVQSNECASNIAQEDIMATYKLAEKRDRNRDRFKTIKIDKQRSGNIAGGALEGELNVPCIDDDEDEIPPPNAINIGTVLGGGQRYSRREQSESTSNTQAKESKQSIKSTLKLNPNYLTYKKSRDKQSGMNCDLPEVGVESTEDVKCTDDSKKVSVAKSRLEPRSLSRPRYISNLQKFGVVGKATSASELEKTAAPSSALQKPLTLPINAYGEKHHSNTTTSNFQSSGGCEKRPSELKSPLGMKSKSLHNLSNNFGYASGSAGGIPAPKTASFGVKKNNGNNLNDSQTKANPTRSNAVGVIKNQGIEDEQSVGLQTQRASDAPYKVPKLVSGIRAPGAVASKRAGLVRPSSGYYSLNVTSKTITPAVDVDTDNGRNSPTDSMSSASSRGSGQNGTGTNLKMASNGSAVESNHLPITLTKITTGSTGIPKPSGLRPPSNIKRSGLPRPSSLIRR